MAFTVKGANIKISFSFILILLLSVLVKAEDLIYVLLFSSLHEAGHLLMLTIFGGKIKEINVAFYGIGLKYQYQISFVKELLFYLSGVFVNLIFLLHGIKTEINLALIIINILPLYPLDGGRALKLIFDKVFKFSISDKLFCITSVVFIIFLIFSGIRFKNFSIILISVYVLVYFINNLN